MHEHVQEIVGVRVRRRRGGMLHTLHAATRRPRYDAKHTYMITLAMMMPTTQVR
jgi:hypothetical protein